MPWCDSQIGAVLPLVPRPATRRCPNTGQLIPNLNWNVLNLLITISHFVCAPDWGDKGDSLVGRIFNFPWLRTAAKRFYFFFFPGNNEDKIREFPRHKMKFSTRKPQEKKWVIASSQPELCSKGEGEVLSWWAWFVITHFNLFFWISWSEMSFPFHGTQQLALAIVWLTLVVWSLMRCM